MSHCTPDEIDALLPQTQCGLCGYDGCMPYAIALADKKAPIHLCPPGGVSTLKQLGELLAIDVTPFLDTMRAKQKPPALAVIRESECIGCTKCIQACPVDAIIGSAKSMHTVIADQCTGCELCIPPCPVDCIDLVIQRDMTDRSDKVKNDLARKQFNARKDRLAKENAEKEKLLQIESAQKKQQYIQAAILRVQAKKG